jgi:hypothetical protein
MKNEIDTVWSKADAAWNRGIQAYLDWCAEIKKIYDAGGATQEQIGARYDRPQQRIADAIQVATDPRFKRLTFKDGKNVLPIARDKYALYLLTTLDDEGFEELAKPGVTQAKILEYKRRLKTPVVTPLLAQRPPCPGVEGNDADDWYWHEPSSSWKQRIGLKGIENQFYEVKPADLSEAEARRILGIQPMTREVLQAIYRYQASVNHPDRGGNDSTMAQLNLAYERLQREYQS